jgi:hypothetical protein
MLAAEVLMHAFAAVAGRLRGRFGFLFRKLKLEDEAIALRR